MGGGSHYSFVDAMTAAIQRMVIAIRREAVAWFIAGVGLHLMIKNGASKWTLAALGMSLGIGASARSKRKRKPSAIEPD